MSKCCPGCPGFASEAVVVSEGDAISWITPCLAEEETEEETPVVTDEMPNDRSVQDLVPIQQARLAGASLDSVMTESTGTVHHVGSLSDFTVTSRSAETASQASALQPDLPRGLSRYEVEAAVEALNLPVFMQNMHLLVQHIMDRDDS
eukprot:Skav210458  [mRNA]  locus=scaffold1297:313064:314936:- [translate_table: standard]